MTCRHHGQRTVEGWGGKTLQDIHAIHADPKWVKENTAGRSGPTLHSLQTYRMAVRQELRKRGLPVHL